MTQIRFAPPARRLGMAVLFLAGVPLAHGQQFQEQTTTRFPSPNPADYTNYVEVGDLEGDGDLDLVFANGGNFSSPGSPQKVRIFINDGAGVFTDESDARTGGLTGNFRGVALGDADDDGDLDILLASDFGRQPRLLINDGVGVFTDETGSRLPALTLSATRGQFADIDNDGDLDIAINDGGPVNRFGCGQTRVLINDGAGVFTDETSTRFPLGNRCEPMDLILGDIDNDLDLDIRTGNLGTDNSGLYENDGTGIFSDISGLAPDDSNCYSYDFGDMNGDGNLDLVGANAGPSNRELLLAGDGTGTFTDASSGLLFNPTADDNDSKFFDLDNDGDLDLIIAALFQNREKIYINDGTGRFTLDSSLITASNDATLDVAVADFDSDGRLDIVTAQGESGTFQNRIYMNVDGPPDTLAPNVIRTEAIEDGADPGGPYVVRATIFDDVTSDRGFFDRGVSLHYSVDDGDEQEVPMKWSGNMLWRGVIPGQPDGSTVAYFVSATDFAGNVGVGPGTSFTVGAIAGDLDGDGVVGFSDLLILLSQWGPCPAPPRECPADLDGDGSVGLSDLLTVLTNWG